jgi:hypothetical protein
MRQGTALLLAATLGSLGCGDGGTSPPTDTDGARLAGRFERLADSVDGAGYTPTAEALRHAAEIVRLTGHATPVSLTVDGTSRPFLSVAEQLDFPTIVCSWPGDSGSVPPGDTLVAPPPDSGGVPGDTAGTSPPGSGSGTPGAPPIGAADSVPPVPPSSPGECTEVGTFSMRTLIAWEPERMAEVVRLVADVGANTVVPGVPDVMTGLPTNPGAAEATPPDPGSTPPDPGGTPTDPGSTPPDSGGGTGGGWGGYPGFMGEYLVADQGTWFAVEGSETNALEGSAGSCTADRAAFDWAEFRCQAAQFRFGFTMRVEPLRIVPAPGPVAETPPATPDGEHTLALAESAVDGVRLSVVAWSPPPPPPLPPPGPGPEPLPPDSAVTGR